MTRRVRKNDFHRKIFFYSIGNSYKFTLSKGFWLTPFSLREKNSPMKIVEFGNVCIDFWTFWQWFRLIFWFKSSDWLRFAYNFNRLVLRAQKIFFGSEKNLKSLEANSFISLENVGSWGNYRTKQHILKVSHFTKNACTTPAHRPVGWINFATPTNTA